MRVVCILALSLAALCASADPTDSPVKAAPNVTVTEVRTSRDPRASPPRCSLARALVLTRRGPRPVCVRAHVHGCSSRSTAPSPTSNGSARTRRCCAALLPECRGAQLLPWATLCSRRLRARASQTVYVRSTKNFVYRSRDEGKTWEKQNWKMEKAGTEEEGELTPTRARARAIALRTRAHRRAPGPGRQVGHPLAARERGRHVQDLLPRRGQAALGHI